MSYHQFLLFVLPLLIDPCRGLVIQKWNIPPVDSALSRGGQQRSFCRHYMPQLHHHHPSEKPSSSLPSSWYKVNRLDSLCKKLDVSLDTLQSHYLDATYYGYGTANSTTRSDETKSPSDVPEEVQVLPLFARLRDASTLYSIEQYQQLKQEPLEDDESSSSSPSLDCHDSLSHSEEMMIMRAENAVEATYRWCSNFVQHLNLCPWAKQSLLSENAIRIKVIDLECDFEYQNQNYNQHCHGLNVHLEAMEHLVRQSAIELKQLTDGGVVDPYIGISFVVSLPPSPDDNNDDNDGGRKSEVLSTSEYDNTSDYANGFDFISFYEFFHDLEERLLDEEYESESDRNVDNGIGDEVTIAPFHPKWSFANPDASDEETDDPVNFEKRTPYPTISIVMSYGIDLAGEEMTSKIGLHNEEILREMGNDALKELFDKSVLLQSTENE